MFCKCGEEARADQATCNKCHAKYMREWRATNEISEEARKRANARSYAKVYIKRGYIKKGVCEVCGSLDVQMHHENYNKPLEIKWLCKPHHLKRHGAYHMDNKPIKTPEKFKADSSDGMCKVDGCYFRALKEGFCRKHWEKINLQNPE